MLDVLEVHPGSFLRYGAYRHRVPLQFERVVDALEDTARTRCGLYDDQRGEEVAAGHRALSCPDQLLPPAGVDGKRSWAVSPRHLSNPSVDPKTTQRLSLPLGFARESVPNAS